MADFLTSIGDFLGLNKGKATSAAAQTNQGLIDQYGQQAGGYLDQAQGNSQSLVDLYRPGANLYQDALGVNGDAGNTRATDAFHTSPGYDFGLDQGIQALQRTAASRGETGGGQLPIDLLKYGVGTADSEYGNWLNRLGGDSGLLNSAVAGENSSLGNLAGLAGDVTGAHLAANNQDAAGQEAGQGGLWTLLDNIGGVAGSIAGLNKPKPAMAGFGSYGSY